MQFEEFDKRIKEAADHHHPAYDEQAWTKMEKLLDKHMPVKKDRRRGIIFFLLFLGLLTGGASYYYFAGNGRQQGVVGSQQSADGSQQSADDGQQYTGSSTQSAAGSKQSGVGSQESIASSQQPTASSQQPAASSQQPTASSQQPAANNQQPTASSQQPAANNQQPTTNSQQLSSNSKHSSSFRLSNTNDRNTSGLPVPAEKAGTAKINSTLLKKTYDHAVQDDFNNKLKQNRTKATARKEQSAAGSQQYTVSSTQKAVSSKQSAVNSTQSAVSSTQQPETVNTQPATGNAQSATAKAATDDARNVQPAVRNTQPTTSAPLPEAAKAAAAVTAAAKKKHEKSTFFISASGGPDVSVVGVSTTGKVKLVGGAGLGYSFRNKFTLRTGFYTARKVYTASADQYHPPAAFWNYYPNLQKVDADCKVYEIPVLFSYNFAKKGNGNWFAGTGISSYLMKRETYNYFYKNSAGINTSRKYTLLDKNHHYFSVLTLSAGYQRNLGHGLIFSAEPYFKVPLSGIGYGKINLNGAGVLFSAGWAPFQTKKAKPAAH